MAFFKKKNVVEEAEPMDLDSIMKKYDKESTTRVWEGVPKIVVSSILALFSLMCIYVTFFATWLDELRLATFMAYIIFIGYMVFPAKKGVQKTNHLPWYDIVLMLMGAGAFLYFAFNAGDIVSRYNITILEVFIGIVGIISLVELCRRSVGLPILLVAGALLIYALIWGLHNPDFFARITESVRILFYSKEGILSTPINACSKFIVVFLIFGAFLERTGIAAFFISLANSLVGGMSGGPAKVAVISSALCGMVSGSSVGNTVTTGSVTIPMMKKTGYKGDFAGAVEAAASTGGQIMPPIMGAAAFLMAEYTGLPYAQIAVLAILPALLYFAGIFIAVHLEAKRLGLKGIPKDELPKFRKLAKKIYLLAPLVILVVMVSNGTRTMQSSAAIAIAITIIVGIVNNLVNRISKEEDKSDNITVAKCLDALEAGAKGTVTVAAACAMAGIVAGCITTTGLASTLLRAIVSVSGGQAFIALFLTMLCCIVLGMGVPTTANYCIMAATCAPILTSPEIGIPMLAAHFFVFYFGIVADITPPVALAAYAGAAIAKAPPMKTALNATRLAIGAFIVPYIFALNPAMLFLNAEGVIGGVGIMDVAMIVVSALLGIYAVAAGLAGFFQAKLNPVFRLILVAGGLLMLIPGGLTDIIGLAVLVGIYFIQKMAAKKAAA